LLGYVKPVKLSMNQLPQTAVELPCTTDYTSCRVQHSLQLVGDDLWSPSENNVTVVDAGRHEGEGSVYWLLFLLCPVTDISATVAPIGVKICLMVHIGPGQVFSPFGDGTPLARQIRHVGPKFWSFDHKHLG